MAKGQTKSLDALRISPEESHGEYLGNRESTSLDEKDTMLMSPCDLHKTCRFYDQVIKRAK